MTEQPILTGEEIEALVRRGGDSPGGRGRRGPEPHPFSFGAGSSAPVEMLPAIDRLNERLARRLREVVEPFLRARPRVDPEPADMRPLRDWQAEQPVFAGFSVYGIKPLPGVMAIAIPSHLVSRLVDSFYGGTGTPPAQAASEFTPTEARLLAKISDGIAAVFIDVWREIVPMELEAKGRETNVALAGIGAPGELVAVSRFIITPVQGDPATIDVLLPAAGLRTVEATLLCKGEAPSSGGAWRQQLGEAVGDIRIDARTVLARPELSLAELVQLKVGDVIPVSIPALVPLLVEGRTVALGTIGEQDGRAALKIDRIETRRNA